MIAPLLDEGLDEAKRRQLREEIAARYEISKRSLYRYEAEYREKAFDGLRPMNREKRRSQALPENYDEIVGEAIQLKREVPKRSVRQIIKILETEGYAAPGVLKASTLQRYLYNAGLGVKQMKRYTEKRETSSRRFCRPHRMELLQGDIKYGPDIRLNDGTLIKTYLSSLIDDHSRFIIQSEFYDNQRQEIVEDTFHKAILKQGKCDACYLDNGTQYTTDQLHTALARLGIRVLHAKPRACQSKGKIEKFYQKEAHDGIREYYESHGVKVPAGGISPMQEFNRDTRGLIFLDATVVSEAFLHHETRKLDNAGCFSFGDVKYEASTALANAEVEIAYDPMNTETIKVVYQDMKPIMAHRVSIGAFCDKTVDVPVGMTDKIPETSRFLDALEKKYKEDYRLIANALSFGDYGKAGGSHV